MSFDNSWAFMDNRVKEKNSFAFLFINHELP